MKNSTMWCVVIGVGLCLVANAQRKGRGTWATGGGVDTAEKGTYWTGDSGNVYRADKLEDLSPAQLADVRKRIQKARRAM